MATMRTYLEDKAQVDAMAQRTLDEVYSDLRSKVVVNLKPGLTFAQFCRSYDRLADAIKADTLNRLAEQVRDTMPGHEMQGARITAQAAWPILEADYQSKCADMKALLRTYLEQKSQ